MTPDPEVERLVAQYREQLESIPAEFRLDVFECVEALLPGLLATRLRILRKYEAEDWLREQLKGLKETT